MLLRRSSSLLLRFLQHLLHDLLFFNKEGPDDTVLDATSTAGAAIGTRHGLLRAGDLRVFTGSEGGNALEFDTAVTTFWGGSLLLDVKVSEVAAWGLDDTDFV